MLKRVFFIFLLISTISNATIPTKNTIVRLYIATFARVADSSGLDYWLSSGLSLEEIAQSFSEQAETKLKYPDGFSTADFIQVIYQNTFKREVDSDGFDYWIRELENNSISRSLFILAVINGAIGDDADLLANQLTVGLKFAEAGRDDINEAKTILSSVTKDAESVSPALCNHTLVTDGCEVIKEEETKTPEIKPKEEEKKVEEDIVVPIIIVPTPVIPPPPANKAPTATPQSITVDEDTSNNTITLAGTDLDNDSLTFIIESNTTHGTLTGTAPNILYTPTADYFGTDSFTFKVNDGTVDSSSNIVTITVTDVAEPNHAPTLTATTLSIDENATSSTVVGKVLVDSNGSSDITNYELNDTTNFSISTSGIISTASTFDFETKTSYSLEVNATNGEVSDSVVVTININNIGEVIPILLNTIINIDENATINSSIGSILFTTKGDTNITSFDINTTIFEINASGHINIIAKVDYETKAFYYLSATATNEAGTSNSVDVNISIGDDTNDLFINSAVFDDNSTTDKSDDKLNIYFTKDIDSDTVSTDSFTIYGDGLIDGSGEYNSSWFNYKISLSVDSEIFSSDSNISIADDTINATEGYELYYETKSKIEQINKFSRLQTGDTNTTITNSDGDLKRGLAHNYLDNGDGTITDNNTALIWQKEDDNNTYSHINAIGYCEDLDLGDSTEWRLPTIDELVSITYKGKVDPAINPIFTNTNSDYYWSFSSYAKYSSNAWVVNFNYGIDFNNDKDNDNLVRCVRDGE